MSHYEQWTIPYILERFINHFKGCLASMPKSYLSVRAAIREVRPHFYIVSSEVSDDCVLSAHICDKQQQLVSLLNDSAIDSCFLFALMPDA